LEKTQNKIIKKALKEKNPEKQKDPLEPIFLQENEKQEISFRRHSEEEKLMEGNANESFSSKKTGPYQFLPEESPALPVIIEMQVMSIL